MKGNTMGAIFQKDDSIIDFIPAEDTAAGDFVILEDIVGITTHKCRAGRPSALMTRGCFSKVPKHNAANALTAGQKVYLNPADKKVYGTASTGYIHCGFALKAAEASAATCSIMLVNSGEIAK